MNKALLTSDEAAQYLGISLRMFLSIREEPWMPLPIILGPRLLRWSIDDLQAAISNAPRQTERARQPEQLADARLRKKNPGIVE